MFAQESVMDIQNIVTEQDTETLDAEIAAMTAAFTEEHYLNNDEAEHLEMIAAKSMVLGELYERAKWQAKAQAVPEGFVILKASDVREILSNASDAMDAESPSSVFTQTGIPSTWYDHHLVAEKNILDAIKAQEPTND